MSIVISKKNKFIFFHLPKNAGSAVANLLVRNESFYYSKIIFSKFLRNFSNKDNFFFDNNQKKLHFFRSHESIRYIEKLISGKIFNDYYKFAIVRNPYSRFVSRYNYTKLVFKDNELKFPDFLKNHLKSNLLTDRQYQFLLNSNNEIGVNKVIKFENLEKDLEQISNEINIDPKKLKKINVSTYDDYRNYYNNETKEIVKNFSFEDLNYFDYNF